MTKKLSEKLTSKFFLGTRLLEALVVVTFVTITGLADLSFPNEFFFRVIMVYGWIIIFHMTFHLGLYLREVID